VSAPFSPFEPSIEAQKIMRKLPLILARVLPVLAGTAALATFATACGDNLSYVPNYSPYESPSTQITCLPNRDGKLEASEMAPTFGAVAQFLVNPSGTTRPVSASGTVADTGARTWDFGDSYKDDRSFKVAAKKLDGLWYASKAGGATFATPFDAAGTLDAVYHIADDGLYLHGIVSAEEKPANGQTLLLYETPIRVFPFPLTPGAKWNVEGTIRNGVVAGQPYAGKDTYSSEDVALGRLILPDLTFTEAHAIRTTAVVTPAAGVATTTRQIQYISECYGEVARAVAKTGDTNPDFSEAAELRRLGLAP
jgi:hypothetical protein